jgi:hypothetical protein
VDTVKCVVKFIGLDGTTGQPSVYLPKLAGYVYSKCAFMLTASFHGTKEVVNFLRRDVYHLDVMAE